MSLESRASQRNYSRSEKPPLPAKPSRTSSRASLASNQSRASSVASNQSRASIASSIHSTGGANHDQELLNRSINSRASVASNNSQLSNTNSGQGQNNNETNESNTKGLSKNKPKKMISNQRRQNQNCYKPDCFNFKSFINLIQTTTPLTIPRKCSKRGALLKNVSAILLNKLFSPQ